MKFRTILFLLAATMPASANLEHLRYEALDNKHGILVVSRDGFTYAIVLNDGVKLYAISPEKIELEKPNSEHFSISLPRPSIVTFVSGDLVSSLPRSKTAEIVPILKKKFKMPGKL